MIVEGYCLEYDETVRENPSFDTIIISNAIMKAMNEV